MKVGQDRRVPESACTACGELLDGCTGVGSDNIPTPGSITVCIKCGHVMAFGIDLKMRELTADEMHEVAGDPRILAIQWARGKAKENKMSDPWTAAADLFGEGGAQKIKDRMRAYKGHVKLAWPQIEIVQKAVSELDPDDGRVIEALIYCAAKMLVDHAQKKGGLNPQHMLQGIKVSLNLFQSFIAIEAFERANPDWEKKLP